jgi:hypothetical protein
LTPNGGRTRSNKALSEGLEGLLTSSQRLARQTQRSARQKFRLSYRLSYPKPPKQRIGRNHETKDFRKYFRFDFRFRGTFVSTFVQRIVRPQERHSAPARSKSMPWLFLSQFGLGPFLSFCFRSAQKQKSPRSPISFRFRGRARARRGGARRLIVEARRWKPCTKRVPS